MLGAREPGIYGDETLAEINRRLETLAAELGVEVAAVQYNEEEDIVGAVRGARGRYDGIIINPACYTHTSAPIAAALQEAGLPYVEVHLSNPYAREEFRHRSTVAAGALGRVMGFKSDSYLLALRGLVSYLT